MTIAEMLSDLRSKGIVLWVEDERLKYRAPQGVLTAEIKSQLAQCKPEVVAFLRQQNEVLAPRRSPISPAPHTGNLPLSFSEEGIWSLEQLRPGTAAWNMQSSLRLLGELDSSTLEASLNDLIRRQEILRTAFKVADVALTRVVTPDLRMTLPVIDLNRSGASEDNISRITLDDAKRLFDLTTAPLFRITLLRINETEHVLLFTRHHIITDAWSSRVFLSELFALYQATATDFSPRLPELAIRYSDYAFWVRQFNTDATESDFLYWQRQLDGARVFQLPSDYPRIAIPTFHGSRQRIALPPSLVRAIRALCKQERATPFMILLAAFTVLFYRYTGERDIVVGSTVAGRTRSELEHLIGMFVNLLPLRANLSGDPSFREVLRRVRETCLDAYQHQEYPFEKLAQQLSPTRAFSQNPFFQVLFNVVNLPSLPTQVNGLNIEPMPAPEDAARFDLTLFAPQTPNAMQIIASYNDGLFSSGRIAAMLEQTEYLLKQAVENPDRQISDYSLLTASAESILPDPTVPLDDSWHGAVHEIFASWAHRRPNKIAVEDPYEAWSYKELNDRSNQLARYLLERQIAREQIVAVYAQRSAGLIWALLGVLKAGAAFCLIDPSHPAGRVKEYLDVLAPQVLIETDGAAEANPGAQQVLQSFSFASRLTLPGLASVHASGFLSEYATDDLALNFSPDDLACVIFTSGSTGKPKGVMGRHGPLTHFLPWVTETFQLSENDRFTQLAGISSNILQREVFTALCLGATLCVPDTETRATWLRSNEWIGEKQATVVHLTPAMAQLLEHGRQETLPSVRRIFFAGDLLTMRVVESVRRLMPAAEIISFYNSSETQRSGAYKILSREEVSKDPPLLGRGMKNVQLLVLNRSNQLAGVGELGEICVRTPHLARGYLKDATLTRERFVPNPFTGIDGDRIYRTGEQGRYVPNGELEFVSRGQRRVNIRGFRLELGEIENGIGQHPAVQQVGVTAREYPPGETRLAAYIVLKNGHSTSARELRDFLKDRLHDYMIPSTFVFLESLPLNLSGKIDYRSLPAPKTSGPEADSNFLPPTTPLEKVLAQSCSEILGVEQVGVQDSFFELGGHSLLALQWVARIQDAFKVELPLRCLYETPTVAGLAAAVVRAAKEPVRIERTALLLLQLAQLSEDQVTQILKERSSPTLPGSQ